MQNFVEETRAFLHSRNAGINDLLLLTFVYGATPRLESQRSRAYCAEESLMELLGLWLGGDYLISQELVEHSTKAWRSAVDALDQTSDFGATLMENIKVPSSLLLYTKLLNPSF
jgi:hypothetical protein